MTSVRFEEEEEEEKKSSQLKLCRGGTRGPKGPVRFTFGSFSACCSFQSSVEFGTEVALQLFFVTAVERRESRFSTEEDVNFRGGRRAPAQIWL